MFVSDAGLAGYTATNHVDRGDLSVSAWAEGYAVIGTLFFEGFYNSSLFVGTVGLTGTHVIKRIELGFISGSLLSAKESA